MFTKFIQGFGQKQPAKPRASAPPIQAPTIITSIPSAHSREELSAALDELKPKIEDAEKSAADARGLLSSREADLRKAENQRDVAAASENIGELENCVQAVLVYSALISAAQATVAQHENETAALLQQRRDLQQRICAIDAAASRQQAFLDAENARRDGQKEIRSRNESSAKLFEIITTCRRRGKVECDEEIANAFLRTAHELELNCAAILTWEQRQKNEVH